MSYARADAARAGAVAAAAEQDGRSLWWDSQLASGEDYASVIEREIAAAGCVLVGWSGAARDSLWVRAEANEALDQGKLVQINFDGAKLPLPFTMLHWLDFRGWGGAREQAPWPELGARIDVALGHKEAVAAGARPNPGGVPVIAGVEPPLQGFGRVAALGWIALATAIGLALAVLMVVRRFISAEAFGAISIGAAIIAALLLATTVWLVVRVERVSRR